MDAVSYPATVGIGQGATRHKDYTTIPRPPHTTAGAFNQEEQDYDYQRVFETA